MVLASSVPSVINTRCPICYNDFKPTETVLVHHKEIDLNKMHPVHHACQMSLLKPSVSRMDCEVCSQSYFGPSNYHTVGDNLVAQNPRMDHAYVRSQRVLQSINNDEQTFGALQSLASGEHKAIANAAANKIVEAIRSNSCNIGVLNHLSSHENYLISSAASVQIVSAIQDNQFSSPVIKEMLINSSNTDVSAAARAAYSSR